MYVASLWELGCLIVEAKRENIETFLKFYESSSHSQEPEKHTYTHKKRHKAWQEI